MQIEQKKITEIKPYENNPRINDASVEYVANSIREFGFKQPIVIDRNNVIVCGHTRLKAAERLGIDEVPCIMADDLTDEQIKAYRLADNKVGETSEWDFELLNAELDGILDLDMSEFGFDIDDVQDTEIIEDGVPEIDETKEPKAKLGDIYQLGRHRLMCGDSTNADDVSALMGGRKRIWCSQTRRTM